MECWWCGGAVDARVGPALFPAIKVGLGFLQTLEAQAFQRCSLRMTDAGFDFAFAVRVLNAAGHGDRAVVREHVAIKRIERGIVHVGDENALAQIIELMCPVPLCGRGGRGPHRFRGEGVGNGT